MLVAGFDTETTGLDTVNDKIIEAGVVLYDTERRQPMVIYSALINWGIQELDPRITELTGIKLEDLERFGRRPEDVFYEVNALFAQADAIVAHNGNLFDRPMYANNLKSLDQMPVERPWVDTTADVAYPPNVQTRKLTHLAAEHGFLNPFSHRAIFDVLSMLRVTDSYDWSQILEYAKAPTIVIRAESHISQKELVKKQNFRWDPEKRLWHKSIKEFQLEDARKAAKEAGFAVSIMKGNV